MTTSKDSKTALPPLPEENGSTKVNKEAFQEIPPSAPPIADPGTPKQKPKNRAWLLIRTMFQNQRPLKTGKGFGKKTLGKWAVYLIALLSFCPFLFFLGLTSQTYFNLGFGQVYLTMYFIMQCLFALLTVIFAFPTVFYFSSDNKTLLALPFRPFEIVWAKTILVLSTQALVMIGGTIPLLIGYALSSAFHWSGLFYLIGSELLIHLTLFEVVGTLCLVLFACLPKIINKDRFTLVTSVLALALSLSLAILGPRMGDVEVADTASLANLMIQLQTSLGFLSHIFFQIPFAASSVMGLGAFWNFAIELIIFIVGFLIYSWAANHWYLDSAMAADWTTSSKKKVQNRQIQVQAPWKAYLQSEVLMLIKTPAYVFNVVGSSFIVPIVLGASLLVQKGELETLIQEDLLVNGQLVIFGIPLWSIALSLGLFTSLFMSGVSGTSATAISRMGLSGVAWMKEIPMSISQQVLLKCVPGIVLSIISTQLLVIVLHLFVPYPLWLDGFFFLGNMLASVFNNLLGIITDLLHPRLVWENEMQAVKNNFNSLIDLGVSTLLLLILLIAYVLFSFPVATIFASLFIAALIGWLYWLIRHKASDWLMKDR